ncbi:PDZ domain-containing protein [Microbulbifer hainanensis]|uniref:PDZ domain-containing protein n=1 Tax=Microbulbifer hainanensis TaxID=2735675 RepID=UPI00186838E1|nr:PDZ domain-containing protein [Microbulbifer hainanensis]
MRNARPALIAVTALLLIAITYFANGALNPAPTDRQGSSAVASLFSSESDSLEQRVEQLEVSLRNANQIQLQLLELVEELRQRLEQSGPAESRRDTRTAALTTDSDHGQRQSLSRRERHQQYREMQLKRLIDAGLNPDRAEYILDKQERFQYEHMKIAYQYRHLRDKSSEEAAELREQLDIYSNPRKMFEHQLSPQEFELYLDANGGRQEMRIDNVVSGTPASEAGLHPGDKIVTYNGERVFHMGDLRSQIYKVEPGKTVTIEVQRAGSSGTETLYVPSGPLGIRG